MLGLWQTQALLQQAALRHLLPLRTTWISRFLKQSMPLPTAALTSPRRTPSLCSLAWPANSVLRGVTTRLSRTRSTRCFHCVRFFQHHSDRPWFLCVQVRTSSAARDECTTAAAEEGPDRPLGGFWLLPASLALEKIDSGELLLRKAAFTMTQTFTEDAEPMSKFIQEAQAAHLKSHKRKLEGRIEKLKLELGVNQQHLTKVQRQIASLPESESS